MAFANFDRRRINGPEESFPPFYEDEPSITLPSHPVVRSGRSANEIRPIFLQPGLVSQANGSAYIETERTKIVCAVYGPRQSKNVAYSDKGRLNVEVKYTPFSSAKRKAPIRDAEDRSLGVAIAQALSASVRLELLPKSTIDIFIIIIEADGLEGCIAAGSVAASTALADAGIEMFGLVVSCSACVVGEEIWLDPTEEEVQKSSGSLVLSCLPALDTITGLTQFGQMLPSRVFQSSRLCQEKCLEIHSVVAQALVEHESSKNKQL